MPFTIVLAPDGKVIYQEMGEISMLELRRAILAHLPDGVTSAMRPTGPRVLE